MSSRRLGLGWTLGAVAALAVVWAAGAANGDLLAFYPFDDGSYDDTSGHNNHGNAASFDYMPIYSATGGADGLGYMTFDGLDDYIRTPLDLNPFVDKSGETPPKSYDEYRMPKLTMGAWVRTTDVNTTKVRRSVISSDNGGYDRGNLGVDNRSTTYTMAWNATAAAGSRTAFFQNTPALTGAEGWVFLAVVYDNLAQRGSLYVNDQRFDSNVVHGYCEKTYTDIGGNVNYAEMWSGDIDNVFILDEALTPAQIASIRTGGKAVLDAWTYTPPVEPTRTVIKTWDFEDGTRQGFNVVAGSGTTFNNQPVMQDKTDGTTWNEQGLYFIRTYQGNGDGPTGVVQTDPFVLLPNAKIDLKIGGGGYRGWRSDWDPDTVISIDTISAGFEAVTLERQVGTNDWEMIRYCNGYSVNEMMPVSWDLAEYAGQTVRLRIYDLNSGSWGQVVVDNIVYSAGEGTAPHAGDANKDGKVDDLDASILAANWQRMTGATWEQADFNKDGAVNDLDASILAANWQFGVGAAVPEPSTAALLLGLAAALWVWRARR